MARLLGRESWLGQRIIIVSGFCVDGDFLAGVLLDFVVRGRRDEGGEREVFTCALTILTGVTTYDWILWRLLISCRLGRNNNNVLVLGKWIGIFPGGKKFSRGFDEDLLGNDENEFYWFSLVLVNSAVAVGVVKFILLCFEIIKNNGHRWESKEINEI